MKCRSGYAKMAAIALFLWANLGWANGPTPVCSDGDTHCGVGELYQNVSLATYSGIQIFYIVCILMGIAGTIFGLLKLKQHGSDSQGTSGALRQAIYSLIISALLIVVPVVALLVSGSLTGQTIPMVDVNTVANYGQATVAN